MSRRSEAEALGGLALIGAIYRRRKRQVEELTAELARVEAELAQARERIGAMAATLAAERRVTRAQEATIAAQRGIIDTLTVAVDHERRLGALEREIEALLKEHLAAAEAALAAWQGHGEELERQNALLQDGYWQGRAQIREWADCVERVHAENVELREKLLHATRPEFRGFSAN